VNDSRDTAIKATGSSSVLSNVIEGKAYGADVGDVNSRYQVDTLGYD
jgi:hypothetical protein